MGDGRTSAQLALDFAAQPEQLARVTGKIADAIIAFCRARVGRAFHADDLRRHVASSAQVAPASADRVLRALRQSGQVRYVVVSRAGSLYRVDEVASLGQTEVENSEPQGRTS